MKKFYFFLFFITLSFSSFSQNASDVAQTFGLYPGFNGVVNSIALQSDGKMIVGGNFNLYKGYPEKSIIRLNTDGTKDTTFNTGTGFNNSIYSIVIQSDGKIIIGGGFTTYNGTTENKIIRLNSDGTKDTSFNTGTGFNDSVYSITLQLDGKIILGGLFVVYQGVTQNRLIRLNSDGTKDTSFNIGTGFNTNVRSTALLPDGRILVGGGFNIYQGVTENRLICLNSDGTKNTFFNTGTGFFGEVYSILVHPDGKIIVGGSFYLYQGTPENRIICLNDNGTKNTSFNIGTGFNGNVYSMIVQPDQKIIVGGNFSIYNGSTNDNRIIRLNSDGTTDTSFNTGTGFSSSINSIALQPDGKIIVGGTFVTFKDITENRIVYLNSDGTRVPSFFTGDGFNPSVYATILQPDGKIIVGGDFTTYKELPENKIIRLNPNGVKDTSFNIGIGFNGPIYSIVLQPDGKIIVGGWFSTYKGLTENKIIRLNPDGTKDVSFNIGTGFSDVVSSIALQPDGKILVGGTFSFYNGTTANRLIRLNSDGTIDTSFDTGTGFNNDILSIIVQPDGKIILGGAFTTYKGLTEKKIIRLNSDGTKDILFNIGTGFNDHIRSIALQTDGKILVGGDFTVFNGYLQNRIIRLNSDGTMDTTAFYNGSGFNGSVYCIMIQPDGKMVIGGNFVTYKGLTENFITRLNSDATKDTTFTGTGFNGSIVYSIFMHPDNRITIGGIFSYYNNSVSSSCLITLYGDSVLSNESFVNQNDVSLWPNPTQNTLNINNSNNSIKAISIYNFEGKLIYENTNNNTTIDISNFASGLYLAKIITEEGEFTKKFIKE